MTRIPVAVIACALAALLALHFWGPKPEAVGAHSVPESAAAADDTDEPLTLPPPVATAATSSDGAADAGDAMETADNELATEPPVRDEPSPAQIEAKEIASGLDYLDSIRKIPGAAPLVDDIVAYLKADDGASFSVEGLDSGAGGLAVVDADANRKMIKDPVIREKWEQLMKLIAAERHD